MESRKLVFKETAIVAAGEAICVAAMIGVFVLLGYYDTAVLLGGLMGGILAFRRRRKVRRPPRRLVY